LALWFFVPHQQQKICDARDEEQHEHTTQLFIGYSMHENKKGARGTQVTIYKSSYTSPGLTEKLREDINDYGGQ
jgi:hypothetical protein